MADYFSSSPNFVNPAYATPEQLATQRAYAAALQKQSDQTVNRPTGALANGLNALTAALMRNNANEVQSQAAQGNANDVSALISQLQSGQKLDPQTLGHLYANPMASPEARALVGQLITPQAVKSEFGQPGTMSPAAGIQAMPIRGPFTPGYRVQQGAEGVHTDAPIPAPGVSPTGPAMPPAAPPAMDAVSPQGGVFGGMNSKPVGWNAPPAAAPVVPNTPMTLDQLAAKGREFAAAKTLTQGGAEAQTGVNQSDIQAAAAAPAVIKDLGVIKGIVQSSPGITFGPTAQMTAEAKRVIANYAPGLVDEKSLAGADAIEKLNIGLAGQLAKSFGGTQGELFKAISATPGTEKSKQGTMVLIDLMQQKAMKDQQLGQLYRQMETSGQLQNYPAAREQFLTQHPVTNPLTGRPVEMDIAAARQKEAQGSFEKTATNPQTGEKLGFRNGRWEPIK